MLWKDVLNNWLNGKYLVYPKNLNKSFLYETSVLDLNKDKNIYKDKFIISENLDKMKQDFSSFESKFQNNKYAVVFKNLSGDSILVVPVPRKNKNFKSLKEFLDNASEIQKKEYFKILAKTIINLKSEKVWISTHGLGVPYLHFRIDKYPKYYHTKNFK